MAKVFVATGHRVRKDLSGKGRGGVETQQAGELRRLSCVGSSALGWKQKAGPGFGVPCRYFFFLFVSHSAP